MISVFFVLILKGFCLRVSLRGEREGGREGGGSTKRGGGYACSPLRGGEREVGLHVHNMQKIDFCFFAVLVLIKRDLLSSRPRVILHASIIKGVFSGGGGREGGREGVHMYMCVLLYIVSGPYIMTSLISCIECSSSIYPV